MSVRLQIKSSETAPATADLILFSAKGEFIPRPFSSDEFDGSTGSAIIFHSENRREIYIGIGDISQAKAHTYRLASAHAIRRAIAAGAQEIAIDVSNLEGFPAEIAEGLTTGQYSFDEFQTKKKSEKSVSVTLVGPKKLLKDVREKIRRGVTIGEATNYVRRLGNLPGNFVTPKTLADEAEALANKTCLKTKVWDKGDLEKDGFGGLLAVGRGSANEPRLIRIDYNCSEKKAPTLVVVGKAITFDSGGLCIKPADQMGEMKFDKMGGCAVLGLMQAVAEYKPSCNVIGILASAENMTGEDAYRPGDIIKTFDGQTVEVANTDAEGRIVLADALGYVRKKVQPDLVIDLATLTGACVVALGEERAGLFCKDAALSLLMQNAGGKSGERVWSLPVGEEFEEQISSKVADVRNLGNTKWGGASTAATFLFRWTENLPHVHLDIAGPAMNDKEKPYRAAGATGFGVGLLSTFIESWTKSQNP